MKRALISFSSSYKEKINGRAFVLLYLRIIWFFPLIWFISDNQTYRASVVNNNINIKESMDWIMKEIDRRRAIYKEKIRQEKKLLKESKKRREKHSMI